MVKQGVAAGSLNLGVQLISAAEQTPVALPGKTAMA